ncbi:hypothetical protein ORJ66_17160 [Pseudoalteromonas tunicata]|uniref:hypothetical protein n=1 Tax=Pseudoalteromonas tunicata TaxID=314281 RepID=UPI00273D65FC|nr:hypothetical protein [Pseudoalteromonas tunicata]MDP5214783.1 hypothetical protein [Pseudoalteromonas tunicata]
MSKISISGNGLNIEREISDELAKEIAIMVLTRGEIVKKEIVKPAHTIKSTAKEVMPEFVDFAKAHNAQRACELVACVAVYLEQQGSPVFSKTQYREYFKEVRHKPSTNAPSDFQWALDANWISRIADYEYKITAIGKKVVSEKFPNTVKGSTRRKKTTNLEG